MKSPKFYCSSIVHLTSDLDVFSANLLINLLISSCSVSPN